MTNAHTRQFSGFTIVELLVVIVVIGILAAVIIVSFTGVSTKAIVASIKSDLQNGSNQLKVFQVTNNGYPLSVTDCPNPASANVCLKLSGDNKVDSYSVNNSSNPQTFSIVIKNGTITYVITESSAPQIPPIFESGGDIALSNGVRAHTFGTTCTSGVPCTITASYAGSVTVDILGAGAGGGGGSSDGGNGSLSGNDGGNSSVLHVTNNATYVATGGTAGTAGIAPGDFCDAGTSGSPGGYQGLGSANLASWTKLSGGGAGGGNGGSGGATCAPGGGGGNGGRLTGSLAMSAGQQLRIVVGAAGTGGYGTGVNGSNGWPGSVVISYPY
jgi:prepilin-type N-terminal cleavage/methylation domain-containing protein